MGISRRDALKTLAAVPALRLAADVSQSDGGALRSDNPALIAIADIVLPSEADRGGAVRAFTEWLSNYREGADTDHGYGNTRVRATGPSPARQYAAQLAALDAAVRASGAAGFAAASRDQQRAAIEAAIAEARIDRLPARPTGAHVATDLMGHYFNSSAANDLCYRAAIGRDVCRALPGSEQAPPRLPAKQPRQARHEPVR